VEDDDDDACDAAVIVLLRDDGAADDVDFFGCEDDGGVGGSGVLPNPLAPFDAHNRDDDDSDGDDDEDDRPNDVVVDDCGGAKLKLRHAYGCFARTSSTPRRCIARDDDIAVMVDGVYLYLNSGSQNLLPTIVCLLR
jgi:hypothetical protein